MTTSHSSLCNVESIIFRQVLSRGVLSFHDFMQYTSTSKERRLSENGIYAKMIEFLCREFGFIQAPGYHCPPFKEWPLRHKALLLWFYLPGNGKIGFEIPEIESCFYSSKEGHVTHWNNVFSHTSPYLVVKWKDLHEYIPDHMLMEAYRREISKRYHHNTWTQFLDHIFAVESLKTIRGLLYELHEEVKNVQSMNSVDLRVLRHITEYCTFQPAEVLFERYLVGHDDSFVAMRQIHYYSIDNSGEIMWWMIWAQRLDVACALDMITTASVGGFRIETIVRAVFDSETYEPGQNHLTHKRLLCDGKYESVSTYVSDRGHEHFWRTLEKAGLVTETSIHTLFDHVSRDVVAELLPMQWRNQEPWSTLIDTFMSKKRRRHHDDDDE